MARWHLLFALAVNAIPAWGVFALGWSVGVLLILFWFENLLGVGLAAARLSLHQRRAVLDPTPVGRAKEFLSNALPFALVHGLFALILPLAFAQQSGANAALWAPRWDDLLLGAAFVTLVMLFDFLLDVRALARRSAASIKAQADTRMARVMVLHVIIIFGAIAASKFDSPYGMLAVMLGLKTVVDAFATRAGQPT